MPDVITLAQSLMRQQSVTPDDADCQAIIAQLLQAAGFYLPVSQLRRCYQSSRQLSLR